VQEGIDAKGKVLEEPRRRNSLRYPGYDYSQAGAVFLTIATHNRQRLFGTVEDGAVIPSPAGAQVALRWIQIAERFPGVMIDAFVVMPDHLHGVLLTGTDPSIPTNPTAGEIVRWFKSAFYADYSRGVRHAGWPPYDGRLWHRDYHDRIVRNDVELDHIRDYIAANPARWSERSGPS
jgi:REP element-mobilizing transposase RayT